jgi:hypothetical protein
VTAVVSRVVRPYRTHSYPGCPFELLEKNIRYKVHFETEIWVWVNVDTRLGNLIQDEVRDA